MATVYIPFTLAYGPTLSTKEREVLSSDIHTWGSLLFLLPAIFVAGGLWQLRDRIAGGRLGATAALALSCVAMVLNALLNHPYPSFGTPVALFLLVPATIALAALIPGGNAARTRTRVVVAALGIVSAVGLAVALIPQLTLGSFGGYLIFGTMVHGLGGLLWAALGLSLHRREDTP